LENPNPQVCKESSKTVDDFIYLKKEKHLKRFFLEEIDALLEKYEPGHPRMKPDAIEQIIKIEKERDEMIKRSQQQQQQQQTIMMGTPDGKQIPLGPEQIVQIIQQQQHQMQGMQQKIMEQDILIKHLTSLQGSSSLDVDKEFLESKVKIQETVIANLQQQIKCLQDGGQQKSITPPSTPPLKKSDPEIHFTIEED
jgi:hypothetical protein